VSTSGSLNRPLANTSFRTEASLSQPGTPALPCAESKPAAKAVPEAADHDTAQRREQKRCPEACPELSNFEANSATPGALKTQEKYAKALQTGNL
jgi:hypothetical protein